MLVVSGIFCVNAAAMNLNPSDPILIHGQEYGMELSDEDVAKLLAKDIDKHKSKAPVVAFW